VSNVSNIIKQINSFMDQTNEAFKTGIEKTSKEVLKMSASSMRKRPTKGAYPNVNGFLYSVSGTLKQSLESASLGNNSFGGLFETQTLKHEISNIFGSSVNRKRFFYPTFHDTQDKFTVLSGFVNPSQYVNNIVQETRKIKI